MIRHIIMWTWCLPQTLLGWLWIVLTRARYDGHVAWGGWEFGVYVSSWWRGGVSLGKVIVVPVGSPYCVIQHEGGHSVQSLLTGPLYLLIVGVPSLCRALYSMVFKKDAKWYLGGYPENWAESLRSEVSWVI